MDAITLIIGFLTCAFGIFMCLSGYGDYQYYPTVEGISISGLEWSMLSLLMLLLLSVVFLAFVKRSIDLD
jgi:hypothetical protein